MEGEVGRGAAVPVGGPVAADPDWAALDTLRARIVGVEKLESSSGVLGGSSAANVAGGADAARAARAAHFDKMFAEKAALKAAAVERLGMGTTDGYVGAKKAAAAPHPNFS